MPATQFYQKDHIEGLPWWFSGKESTCQWRRHEFSPWSGKIPRAAEQLSQCTTTFEPVSSLHTTTTKAHVLRACTSQQEKAPQ